MLPGKLVVAYVLQITKLSIMTETAPSPGADSSSHNLSFRFSLSTLQTFKMATSWSGLGEAADTSAAI